MNKPSYKLNCFSPPVMLATITIESMLAVYTYWRYKLDPIIKLALVILLCLASFQLAEYYVCTNDGQQAVNWSRLGFIMITALPPQGIHLMHQLAKVKIGGLVFLSYFSMALFMGIFLTYKGSFIGHQCSGNYVIFQLGNRVGGLYGFYYYSWLFIGLFLGINWLTKLKTMGTKMNNNLQAIKALIIGYLVFLIPTAITNTIKPETRHAIPSVMCGFAVIFALILTFYIVPKIAEIKIKSHNILHKS